VRKLALRLADLLQNFLPIIHKYKNTFDFFNFYQIKQTKYIFGADNFVKLINVTINVFFAESLSLILFEQDLILYFQFYKVVYYN